MTTRHRVPECFAGAYAQARQLFLEAAQAAGREVTSLPHPLLGREGEAMALDAVLGGDPAAERLLIVSSGCHGVEGFGGSGIQVALLRDAALRQAAHAAGVAVLYLHALNPHGFSWGRRVTHENVDLNRNFVDFGQPLPRNPLFPRLAPVLMPERWPPGLGNRLALYGFALRHGMRATQAAISSGQYDEPEALFYGGRGPTWSHLALRSVLQRFGRHCRKLGWIDLHTGLGPTGVGEPIFAARPQGDALARARAWWGPALTSTLDGSSTSALVTGEVWNAAYLDCGQAEYTGIVLEFGTVPKLQVLDALRGDQWLRQHPEAPAALQARIRQRMHEAFCVDTPAWREALVAQGTQAVQQALRGLAEG